MDRAQVIKELKALKEAFEEERDAYPICLEEAIRLLEQPDGGDMISRKAAIDEQPTIEPEPQIIYSKAGYIMSLHKEYGCTLIRAEEAHNKALEYLRDKAMMKG